MQQVVEEKAKRTKLEVLEEISEAWPKYIRLASTLLQRALAEFISPLLMVGLILSMANYLLGGMIFNAYPGMQIAWVIVQVIAIDANMGIMVVRAVKEFHAGEHVKGGIYVVISLALLFVAAIIFNTEAIQSVVNHLVGTIIPVEWLTLIRSCAIVSLVAVNQLEGVSLRRQKKARISQFREIGAVDLDGKKGEIAGSDTSGNLVAINNDQHRRLLEAYERLTQQGVEITWNRLQRESGVRTEIVGPWLKVRERQVELNGHEPTRLPG